MKKMPTLFKRIFDEQHRKSVSCEVTPFPGRALHVAGAREVIRKYKIVMYDLRRKL